jgi:NTE family protein
MLRALAEAGVVPDLVVGASVGALNGVVVAAHPGDAADRLEGVWRRIDRRTIFGGGAMRAVATLVRSRASLCRPDLLAGLIEEHLDHETFDRLTLPFAAVATDLFTGEPELLSTGAIRPALLASAAIPGVFPRVAIDGRHYIDGGVSANVPIRQAIAFGAASVLVLDANPAHTTDRPPERLVPSLLHTVSVMLRSQRAHAVDELAHRYRVVGLPQVTPADMGSFDFRRSAELIEAAHHKTTAFLASWSDEGPTPAEPSEDRTPRHLD